MNKNRNRKLNSLLCMRRDVSIQGDHPYLRCVSSLHAQRCFLLCRLCAEKTLVFSACAEMFLKIPARHIGLGRLLCMRRDVSMYLKMLLKAKLSSLHAQRCFLRCRLCSKKTLVFSACAEMFPVAATGTGLPTGFLCRRRDVSYCHSFLSRPSLFSLHAQRCFLATELLPVLLLVFSACAEMFPRGDKNG